MNILKHFIVMMGVVLSANSGQAQSIKGYVFDSQTKSPVSGVSLKLENGQVIAQTSENGSFDLNILPLNSIIFTSAVGYKSRSFFYSGLEKVINIQLDADENSLNEVRVTGFLGNRSIKETAGSIAVITNAQINRGNGVSLQSAFNAIPGVRMDQSTLSEARISIRGNGVRASYGNRSLKIYVNDIPVTEADGTTRIEALDVNSLGRAEIIKGPASSIYGAGTAGVINFQLQRAPYQEESLEASALTGSDNLLRLASTYRGAGDKLNSYASYGWQQYDGYREHSKDMRRFLSGNFQLFPDSNRIITLLLNRTTQYSQIPGALTLSQFQENPRQASAGNLEKKAGRYQTWTRVGLGQRYKFNDQFSNSTSVFTYSYDLNHPLPYAYLRNYYQSYGGRTSFSYNPGFSSFSTKFIAGAEFNEGLTKANQFVNISGTEGTITANLDYRNTLYSIFYQSETKLSANTLLTLGLSYNGLKYNISNYMLPQQSGVKAFNPQASPRVALSHNFGDYLSLHASVSSGFSPPSSSEVKQVDGSVNQNLQAEKAMNYEVDAKGSFLDSRISYDLSLYTLNMKDELIAQSIRQGITIYNNAGKTRHNGAELALSWLAFQSSDQRFVCLLKPFVAVTYADYSFRDYKIKNAANELTGYDGNALTGISPWVISAGLDIETKSGLYGNINYYFSDEMPLNDANTDHSPAYSVVNSKVGYRSKIYRSFELNVYTGIDNLLNKNYSSILSLNATGFNGQGPAYYNPSPLRNGYAGLAVKYYLK